MKSYLIGYDLNKAGQDYSTLIEEIKKLGSKYYRCLESTWVIKSDATVVDIRNHLKNYVDKNDELLVVKLSGNWASHGLSVDCNKWLKENLKAT